MAKMSCFKLSCAACIKLLGAVSLRRNLSDKWIVRAESVIELCMLS